MYATENRLKGSVPLNPLPHPQSVKKHPVIYKQKSLRRYFFRIFRDATIPFLLQIYLGKRNFGPERGEKKWTRPHMRQGGTVRTTAPRLLF